MRYVIYNKQSFEVISFGSYSEDSVYNLVDELHTAGIINPDTPINGFIRNYIFVPDNEQENNSPFLKGYITKKPLSEMNIELEEQAIRQQKVV